MIPRAYSPAVARVAVPRARFRAIAHAVPAPAATLVLGVLLLALAFHDGGYFAAATSRAATVACLALVALLAFPPARRRLPMAAVAPLLALVALAAWIGISGRWSPAPDAALLDLRRGALYAGLFGLALVAIGRAQSRTVVHVVLAAIVIVAGAGVLSRLVPELLGLTRGASLVFDERLSFPLGYWNAFGALAATGAVLALGLAADVRSRPLVRGIVAAAGPLLVVAVFLSLSRGAWLALAAGALALLALAPRRASVVLGALVVAGASALAIVRLQGQAELLDGTLAPGPDAPRLAVELVLLCVLAGAAQALLSVVDWRVHVSRRVLAGAAVAAALAGAGVLAQGGAGWVGQQYDAFSAPAPAQLERGTARLLSVRGLRREAYGVAWAGFQAQPLRGEGAGSFERRWERERTTQLALRDPHSLVLGTMTELGAIGLLLLVVFLGFVARAALRARRGGSDLQRAGAAAVAAAVVTWLVHAGIDWDWEMPALTGCALVLCATLFARSGDPLQNPHARGAGRSRA